MSSYSLLAFLPNILAERYSSPQTDTPEFNSQSAVKRSRKTRKIVLKQ
ncbi:hypothetical protein [Acinetobacter pseudolwoffii]|nr:hypothetical protein [Acinetobacter pseudolwoffii]